MEERGIPTLDLSRWLSGDVESRREFAKEWDVAFRTAGFAVIINHGVVPSTVGELRENARTFFRESLAVKMGSCKHDGYGGGGYAPPGAESVARSAESPDAPPDSVESLVFSNGGSEPDIVPKAPKTFQQAVSNYSDAMQALLATLMEISECALSLPHGYFEDYYKGAPSFLRLAYYAANAEETQMHAQAQAAPVAAADATGAGAGAAAGADANPKPDQLRYGAHTDYQGFTILSQDAPGLEVKIGGAWCEVEPQEGAFIINAGDLLQHWTNGLWLSNVHRVVKSPRCTGERTSLVCFTGPRDDAMITPLSQCVEETGGKALYATVSAGDHLQAKLLKTSLKGEGN